jgi:hypothetical protein
VCAHGLVTGFAVPGNTMNESTGLVTPKVFEPANFPWVRALWPWLMPLK